MQIKKITYNGKVVQITYELPDPEEGGVPDIVHLKCGEPPSADFKRALQGLAPHVLSICEIKQKGYDDSLEVRGLTVNYHDGGMGATITAVKKLSTSNTPFVIHTPYKTTESGAEGVESDKCLSDSCANVVEIVLDEARKYIGGLREPMPLFEKDKETAQAA
jgi:hypothetical protein